MIYSSRPHIGMIGLHKTILIQAAYVRNNLQVEQKKTNEQTYFRKQLWHRMTLSMQAGDHTCGHYYQVKLTKSYNNSPTDGTHCFNQLHCLQWVSNARVQQTCQGLTETNSYPKLFTQGLATYISIPIPFNHKCWK